MLPWKICSLTQSLLGKSAQPSEERACMTFATGSTQVAADGLRQIHHILPMKPLIFLVCSLMISAASQGAALVVGGFSTARAGTSSISQGPVTEELRSAIVNAFPGSTFVGVDTLTSSALSTVNLLIVGAPTLTPPVLSLSSAEQTALLNFVRSGGGALIYFDNDTYAPGADAANETFLDPFGIDSTGRVPSAGNATSIAPAHPVMNGPFGMVTSFATNFGGWVENLGPSTALAQYDANGQPAIAAIAPGALAPGSGGVVLIGDADSLVDSADGGLFGMADNQKLLLNSVSFVIPEASTISLLVWAALVCARRVRNPR